ncbi:hypothetical protein MY8738_004100 [Beauveria namnaoensis]
MAYNSQKDTFWLIHDTLYSNGFPRNHPILLQSVRCFHVDALTHVSSKLYGRRDHNYAVLRAAAVGSPTEADLPLPSGETNGQGGPGNDLLQRLAQIPDDAVIGAGLSVWTTTPYDTGWIGTRSVQDLEISDYLEREYVPGQWTADNTRQLFSRSFPIRLGQFRPDVGRLHQGYPFLAGGGG